MAACLYSVNVLDLCSAGDDYVLGVCKLGKSLVLPELIAAIAVPILDVTVLMAVCLGSLEVLNIAILGSGNNYVLDVGELGESLVGPNLLAVVAYPVLNVTVVVTACSNSIEVNKLGVLNGKLYALLVGNSGESLVGPCSSANGAVPILDVTLGVAGGSNSLNVLDGVISIGVGELVAVFAVCVTGIGVLVSNGSGNNAVFIGALSKSLVGPHFVALGAVPVLNVTCFATGGSLCLYVLNSVLVAKVKYAGSKADCHHCNNASEQQDFLLH